VQVIKANSSRWMKTQVRFPFAWQRGYGAFSVSASSTSAVARYIQSQPEHHRRMSFEDEFRSLLKRHGIEYDERYIFRLSVPSAPPTRLLRARLPRTSVRGYIVAVAFGDSIHRAKALAFMVPATPKTTEDAEDTEVVVLLLFLCVLCVLCGLGSVLSVR
jgi:hypothetical protein